MPETIRRPAPSPSEKVARQAAQHLEQLCQEKHTGTVVIAVEMRNGGIGSARLQYEQIEHLTLNK